MNPPSSPLFAAAFLAALAAFTLPLHPSPAVAAFEPMAQPKTGTQARPSLITETQTASPGASFNLAVHFDLEKNWHLYWRGQNDSGQAPEIKLTLPEGWKSGPVQWPAPTRHVLPGDILDHVYFNSLTLIIPIEVPASEPPTGAKTVSAELSWVVCDEACVIGNATVSREITLAPAPAAGSTPSARPELSKDAKAFDAARARHPKPLPATAGAPRVTVADGAVSISAPGAKKLSFYPSTDSAPASNLIADGEAQGDRLTVRLDSSATDRTRVKGILEVWTLAGPKGKSAEGGGKAVETQIFSIDVPLAGRGAGKP